MLVLSSRYMGMAGCRGSNSFGCTGPSLAGRLDRSVACSVRASTVKIEVSVDSCCTMVLNAEMGNVQECGTLVYLHALERSRSSLLAKKALEIFDSNTELASMVEQTLPGVTMRLQKRPTNALEDLGSLRILLKMVEYVDPRSMERLRSFAREMVEQHARVFGATDAVSEHVLDMLPESPLWAFLKWQAIECILQQPVADMIPSLEDPSSLKLTCNSKSSNGLPMSVSMYLNVPDGDGVIKETLKNQLGQYFGKPMSDISTSIWSGTKLRRESISGHVECRDIDGEPLHIDFNNVDYESMVLGLTFVTSYEQGGFRSSIFKDKYTTWLPLDSRIQWRQVFNKKEDVQFEVSVSGGDPRTIDSATIDGLLECMDAISQIDASFSLPPPVFSVTK